MKTLSLFTSVLLALSTATPSLASDTFLVKFKSGITSSQTKSVLRSAGAQVEKSFTLVPGLSQIRIKSGKLASQVANDLAQSGLVEYVAPNSLRKPSEFSIKSVERLQRAEDPAIPPKNPPPTQWIPDPKLSSNFGIHQNRVDEVWEKYNFRGDAKTIIAVIDTGVDYTHLDLNSNMWRNPGESGNGKETNGVDDDNNGYVDDVVGYDFVNKDSLPYDDHYHGTHVAGIAAAVGGNGFGIAGHCSNCSVMGLKFISASGWGSDADAIESLQYAVKMGAQIINCSWGGDEYNQALFDAFKAASDAGAIVVVAAGNEGEDLDFTIKPTYPAKFDFPAKVAVSALNPTNIFIPWWSNYGWWNVSVSTAGAGVYSTIPGGRFDELYGTSMASPGVAGDMGLLKSYRPNMTNLELIKMLEGNVLPDASSMGKVHLGGRPDMMLIFDKLSK